MSDRSIVELEKNKNWLVTAKYGGGHRTTVMRGVPGGQFDGNYYLYDEDWFPAPEGMKAYSLAEIRGMFASGELSVTNGSVPG